MALFKSKEEKEAEIQKNLSTEEYKQKFLRLINDLGEIRWELVDREDWEVLELLQGELKKLLAKAAKDYKRKL